MDCSAYLPVPLDEPTEFGVCLNDEALEPFVEELLEGLMPSSCRAHVERKKFVGDRPCCPDFEESEIIEIDDDGPLGRELRRLKQGGELTSEALEHAIFEEQIRRIDWKTLPVEQYVEQLERNRTGERDAGISSLGAMTALGNPAAFQALLGFLSSLPPPETIDAVHLKKEVLRHLDDWKDKLAVAQVLIKELGVVRSNNTTRQWISEIFRFLEGCPWQVIEGPLRGIITEKTLSPGIRKKAKGLLSRSPGP
jgi:hypothetical protein